jgi:hypothetical protein
MLCCVEIETRWNIVTEIVRLSSWLHRLWIKFLPAQLIFLMGAIGLATGLTCALTIILSHGGIEQVPLVGAAVPQQPVVFDPHEVGPVFTPEVQYWKDKIVQWSKQYGVEANMLATVIQIESCGDDMVGSNAGAQGLFQVMPFHFAEGEDMHDPDTNAKRGIEYLKGGLERADGHIGLAMAGYNGGWGVIDQGWGGWYRETRLYYMWGSQLYLDAINHKTMLESAALQNWLASGGSNLCARASARLFASPVPADAKTDQTAPLGPSVEPTLIILPSQ